MNEVRNRRLRVNNMLKKRQKEILLDIKFRQTSRQIASDRLIAPMNAETNVIFPKGSDTAKLVHQSRSYERAYSKTLLYQNQSDIELYSTDNTHRKDNQLVARKRRHDSSSDSDSDRPQKTKSYTGKQNVCRTQKKPAQAASSATSTCVSCIETSAVLTSLQKSVDELKEHAVQHSLMLQKMSSIIPDFESLDYLPLSTIEELHKLNQGLMEQDEFTKLVQFLGILGGKDKFEAVRRVLSRLISNRLALQLNWAGGEKKTSIQQFKRIINLVAVSVRQNRVYVDTSQSEVENTMKRWLRSACDREGGRVARRKVPTVTQI